MFQNVFPPKAVGPAAHSVGGYEDKKPVRSSLVDTSDAER